VQKIGSPNIEPPEMRQRAQRRYLYNGMIERILVSLQAENMRHEKQVAA